MPPGTYTITVTAPSFQTATTTGVRVAPEQVARTNVVLTIGQLTQNVEVSADAIALQTDRADIRDDVTIRTLQNVPVPVGRNYQMLFVTVPGVSPPDQFEFLHRQFQPRTDYFGQWRKRRIPIPSEWTVPERTT